MLKMEQQIDSLGPVERKRYIHHYNFPPYSTGETGRVGSPKRREVGHGMLAERAIVPVLPSREEFPYAIPQVSEALGPNGATSVASPPAPRARRPALPPSPCPPSATGGTGRAGSPKRREVGHGMLAERAIVPVLPSREEFPYAIRQVSEALGSNGSTSMGSVCASTLSLLNAGVPLRAPVAGIAMGLISDTIENAAGESEVRYAALTDILGAEDAFGDMDFKVAGTSE